MRDEKVNIQPGDEIVIVVPEGTDEDEIVIDLDELGIDVENLEGDVNIVIQVEGEGSDDDELFLEDDEIPAQNIWMMNGTIKGIRENERFYYVGYVE